MGWQDASVVSQGWQSAPVVGGQTPNPNAPQGKLGEIALGARDVGEGVLDTFAAPHDLSTGITNLARRGINRLLGTHMPQVPTFSGQLSNALTSAGAPVASTPGEKLSSAIIRGTAGALTGGGLLGLGAPAAATVPNAVRAGIAGATGGASSDLAREAGAGPIGQFLAGLAGGFTPAALEGGVNAVSALARPFTRAGQSQLAANVLARQAINPQTAATSLSNAAPLVPGSLRTAGEASGDPGLLALEKGIRARNAGAFGSRISAQNAARQTELTKLGGTAADISAAEQARDATTAPMREGAFAVGMGRVPAPVSAVHDTIDTLLKSPAGARESISRTLNWARNLIGDNSDPETLYEVRKDLALAQQGKLQPSSPDAPNASTLAHARKQLGTVIKSLDDSIEAAAPGYKEYLKRYGEMSEPIDQMEAIQGLQQGASSGLDTSTGHPFLSGPMFARQLAALDSNRPFPLRLTPDQTQRLQALREDLQRGNALSSPTVKAPGSDTFQNFMTGNRLGSGLARHIPLVGKYLGGINDFVDQRVNEALSDAMLDPQRAATLLLQGKPRLPLRIAAGRAAKALALPYSAGPIAALNGPNRP